MRKINTLLVISNILLGLIIPVIFIRPVRAVGPIFEDPNGQRFDITNDTYWTQVITVCDSSLGLNFTVGDQFRVNITKTNNTRTLLASPFWIADTMFGHFLYYNSSDGNWTDIYGGVETIIGGYNSTYSYNNYSGDYYYYSNGLMMGFMSFNIPMLDAIPQNYSAANHTIVNMTYTFFVMAGPTDFNYSYSAINRTWVMTNGTETDPWGIKIEVSFDTIGICTRNAMYQGGVVGWTLAYECKILDLTGFSVPAGDSWTHTITVCDPALNLNLSVGDKIRFNITKANFTWLSNFSMSGWSASALFGHILYYNNTNGTWLDINNGAEILIGAYHPLIPYSNFSGSYYFYSNGLVMGFMDLNIPMLDVIPQNFSAANHTIVNTTYDLFSMSGPTNFNYSYIASTKTWILTNGTETDPWGIKIEVTFNAKGICTRNAMYQGGANGWQLVYESKMEGPTLPLELLLSMMMASGGGLTIEEVIPYLSTAGIFFIPLIIGLGIRKAREK